jgi:asparagine synthase (glutamine-hydrolysing)
MSWSSGNEATCLCRRSRGACWEDQPDDARRDARTELLRHMSLTGAERYLDACSLFPRDDMKQLFRPDVFEQLAPFEPWRPKAAYMESGNRNWLSNLQGLDVKNYLPLDILTKVDRMSMAHSIETRVPLLDHKLVEFAATIPPEMNLRNGTTKYVLKQAMRGILPDGIIDRPKQGFAVPLGYWFRGKLGPYVRDLLLGESARRRGSLQCPLHRRPGGATRKRTQSRPPALDSDFVRALG